MKKLLLLILSVLYIGSIFYQVDASWLSDIVGSSEPEINITNCGGNCDDIQDGVDLVKNSLNGVEINKKLSQYIQDVVLYIIGFISFIAVLYIVYAGFMVLIGGSDEEKLKNSKTTIFHVVLGIALIWLAYGIVDFIIKALNS